jgi:chemotaxis protein CheD
MSLVHVRVADWAAAAERGTVLATVGLGSCVAIILHDAGAGVGAMAHVLLPSRTLTRRDDNPAKSPETAVPLLLEEMRRLGARGSVEARLVGGASMFAGLLPSGGLNVGERNIEASRAALQLAGIPVVGEDVGGDYGRSVYFHLVDGRVEVRSLRVGSRVL